MKLMCNCERTAGYLTRVKFLAVSTMHCLFFSGKIKFWLKKLAMSVNLSNSYVVSLNETDHLI